MKGSPWVRVLVTFGRTRYRCRFDLLKTYDTWRCGHCGKGSLGAMPDLSTSCLICGARVCQMNRSSTEPSFSVDAKPFGPFGMKEAEQR